MKKLFLFVILCQSLNFLQAQGLEVKASPVGLVVGGLQLNIEQTFQENWGIEGGIITDFDETTVLSAIGKYYFSPSEYGSDRFNVGVFLNHITVLGPGVGFYLGYKWVTDNNIVFEIGGGVGRLLIDPGDFVLPITLHGQLTVGYRFSRN